MAHYFTPLGHFSLASTDAARSVQLAYAIALLLHQHNSTAVVQFVCIASREIYLMY